jgi:DNA-binding protein HU-beta
MNKAELVQWIHENGDGFETKASAQRALDAVLGGIRHGLKKDTNHTVSLVGFGSFQVKRREGRMGINPQTGEPIKIKASRTVTFRAGKALKEYVPMPKKKK